MFDDIFNFIRDDVEKKEESIDSHTCIGYEFIDILWEGCSVCNKCGIQKQILPIQEHIGFYIDLRYKRINHFREVLLRFQGCETIRLSPEQYIEIKKLYNDNPDVEPVRHIRDILKKMRLHHLLEHVNGILDRLDIMKRPTLSKEEQSRLIFLFNLIESAWRYIRPENRINFLNYQFMLRKLLIMIENTQYIHRIPMMKNKHKVLEHEALFSKMTDIMGITSPCKG